MVLKGGLAYVDCTGLNLSTGGTYFVKNAFKYIKKAYEAKKIVVIHNASIINDKLGDTVTSAVRKRDDTHYAFCITITSGPSAGVTSRYCLVGSDDLISVQMI